MDNDILFQIERQKKILDYVNESKKATVNELSELIGVSKVTIRKYINELESKGLVIKTHGGVVSINSELNNEIPYSSKKGLNTTEKQKIGYAAAQLIEEGDVVILDAGSTTLEIVKHIENKHITIITNDIKIAYELAAKPSINLIITGGVSHKHVYTVVGFETEKFLNKIHANKTFLGADAINLENGITNRTLEEVAIKQAMIKAAEKVILVADHSKLNKMAFADVCKIEAIDTIVIDAVDEVYEKAFREKGINVILS